MQSIKTTILCLFLLFSSVPTNYIAASHTDTSRIAQPATTSKKEVHYFWPIFGGGIVGIIVAVMMRRRKEKKAAKP
jgi:phosphotransferase system  glucose/maltose/N-acetylglucosamine-specific IIC component